MSGLLDALLGAEGCTVDGTIGHNPIASAFEQAFDHFDVFQGELQGSAFTSADDAITTVEVHNFDQITSGIHSNTVYSQVESAGVSWGFPFMPQGFQPYNPQFPVFFAPQPQINTMTTVSGS